jgi:hypothetical protein
VYPESRSSPKVTLPVVPLQRISNGENPLLRAYWQCAHSAAYSKIGKSQGSSREMQIGSDMRMNNIDGQKGGDASLTIASNLAVELISFCNFLASSRFQEK